MALGDPKLRQDDAYWRQTMAGLVQAASDYFEREFRIRLVAERIAPWPLTERTSSTPVLLRRLKENFPLTGRDRSYDLIIGFTGETVDIYAGGRARVDRIGNCHEGLGNYVVASVSPPFRYLGSDADIDWDVLALIHEFGHIFGAEHTDDPTSIMHHDFAHRTEFDQKSRKAILRNRFCPFGNG
ncbi:MAG: M12 family metallo-peptidase [Candidatus Binatia bacterium]